MTDEILTNASGEEIVADNADYISAINEMKQTHVKKEIYDQLKAENKKLLDSLVKGESIEVKSEVKPDVHELRKKLFDKDSTLSNLEYVQTSLQLRDALIENGEADPFLPYGDKVTLTSEHYDKAQHVADVLQECVDFSDGDSAIFTAELQRRMKDTMPVRRR